MIYALFVKGIWIKSRFIAKGGYIMVSNFRISIAILFIAIMVFAAAGLALQTIGASYEVTLLHEIATQVELNRIQLKTLQEEFDQLQHQVGFASTSLRIHYEYFDACSTGEMEGVAMGMSSKSA